MLNVWLGGFSAPKLILVKINTSAGCGINNGIQNQLWIKLLGEIEQVATVKIQSEQRLRDQGWIREPIWVQRGRIYTNSHQRREFSFWKEQIA